MKTKYKMSTLKVPAFQIAEFGTCASKVHVLINMLPGDIMSIKVRPRKNAMSYSYRVDMETTLKHCRELFNGCEPCSVDGVDSGVDTNEEI